MIIGRRFLFAMLLVAGLSAVDGNYTQTCFAIGIAVLYFIVWKLQGKSI